MTNGKNSFIKRLPQFHKEKDGSVSRIYEENLDTGVYDPTGRDGLRIVVQEYQFPKAGNSIGQNVVPDLALQCSGVESLVGLEGVGVENHSSQSNIDTALVRHTTYVSTSSAGNSALNAARSWIADKYRKEQNRFHDVTHVILEHD